MRAHRCTWFGLGLLLGLTACGYRFPDPEDVVWEQREDVDEGFLCLMTEAAPTIETFGVVPQTFAVGGRLAVQYDAARCFTSCDRDITVDGDGTVEGDRRLVVETTLRWENAPPQEGVLCTQTCEQVDVVFPLEPLTEEGTYTLSWAGQETSFEVPGEALACLGTRVYGEEP